LNPNFNTSGFGDLLDVSADSGVISQVEITDLFSSQVPVFNDNSSFIFFQSDRFVIDTTVDSSALRGFFRDIDEGSRRLLTDLSLIEDLAAVSRFQGGDNPQNYGPFGIISYEYEFYQAEKSGLLSKESQLYGARYPFYLIKDEETGGFKELIEGPPVDELDENYESSEVVPELNGEVAPEPAVKVEDEIESEKKAAIITEESDKEQNS